MKLVLAALFVALASANIFLHNPRGSNNRYNADNDNRQNAMRMFNSMNHPRGGYNSGEPMYYYIDSQLTVEWTMSHGCSTGSSSGFGAEEKVNCNVVLQYMCSDWLRDGSSEDTVTANNYMEMDDDEYSYGAHESWDYYDMCMMRDRNMGLWHADRMLNGVSARYTRQNNNGQRYGTECPEERDYYPYWHPTPWKDIAIWTSEPDRCDYYRSQSQNTQAKSWCESNPQANNAEACSEGENGAAWTSGMAHEIEAPECFPAPFTRANHLGNTIGGYPNRYNWTVPRVSEDIMDHCAMRIRYNISSAEVSWELDSTNDEEDFNCEGCYYKSTSLTSPVIRDPYIMFGSTHNISYAMDTRYYGAVFQDRSHEFSIRERPAGVNNKIYNLNVRGKRGNIVETFPAVEYDFVPDVFYAYQHEWWHAQWTGTDQNPANAAGEGLDQTDRTNFVQTDSLTEHMPSSFPPDNMIFTTQAEAVRFAFAGMTYQGSLCKDLSSLLASNDNDNDVEEDTANCMKMNLGSPYFDGGLQKFLYTGKFYYMSSRNNNFTNRSQKGMIVVVECDPANLWPGYDSCPEPEDIIGGDPEPSGAPALAAISGLAVLLQ